LVTSNQAHSLPQPAGQFLPAAEVILGQAVLDADDRKAVDEILKLADQLVAGQPRVAGRFEAVMRSIEEMGAGHIQCQRSVFPGPQASRFDRPDDEFGRLGVARQPRAIAAFIPY
jgi:hypothetical protein